jgi:two-component system, cell cycle sensor histidine kinase and response regulator CckA
LGYITKPFQDAELHASIEMALHKHAEDLKALQQEELLASTLRAIADGVIAVDRSETVTLFNPSAEAWTGMSSEAAIGQPFRQVFPLVDSATGDELDTPLWRVLAEGTVEALAEGALLVDRSGEKRAVSSSLAPTRDHRGDISGAVIVFGRPGKNGGTPPCGR